MLESIAAGATVALLTIFTAVTCVNSVQGGSERLQRILGPFLGLVPKYNFFAPHPGRVDYYLVYRDRCVDGKLTKWQEVDGFSEPPDRLGWLWNPSYYQTKILFDVVGPLTSGPVDEDAPSEPEQIGADDSENELRSIDDKPIHLSVHYLTILKFISELSHLDVSEARQFAIMRGSRQMDGYEPVFVSKFHALEQ
ncbi:hypothetical protein SAMN06269185_1300 [Natronoarchaeum philippinense]|uniref:Uncharacterized protein n=1 Tax=Natronoarchaeum philippinense TaxID=558529 RepID=A0A285NG21_NATPI|nr:hypothetical protein [Natronoarchaeum philippinense]SNZ06826.1 hypothetical protein SAMN06269185_1300 [Natronoarchaeum philippinense]